MTEKIMKGGEYLITEEPCENIFTPEDFSDEQKQFGETTELFAKNEIVPNLEEIDRQNFDIVTTGMRKCGELGLLMMDAPVAYGGLDLELTSSMLVTEKMAVTSAFTLAYGVHTGLGSLPLIYYGTHEQKEKYLTRVCNGDTMAMDLTEPDAGSMHARVEIEHRAERNEPDENRCQPRPAFNGGHLQVV